MPAATEKKMQSLKSLGNSLAPCKRPMINQCCNEQIIDCIKVLNAKITQTYTYKQT